MQTEQDYYKVLEITPMADTQEIKEAYRKLAFQYHPDKNNGSQEANKKMQMLNEAYAILSNPMKRKEYDKPLVYGSIVPKFETGSKVRVSFNSNSSYRNHTGIVDKEPLKDTFRFWYTVKFESKDFVRVGRFAEEELEEVSE